MKIFAKRGSKKNSKPIEDKDSAADRVVLELLKKDPSELNSRDRRAIKRYEDRKKPTNTTNIDSTLSINNDQKTSADEDVKENIGNKKHVNDITEPNDETDDKSKVEDGVEETKIEEVKNKLEDDSSENSAESESDKNTEKIDREELQKLLDSLTSKYKRKLTRRLERDGDAALQSVHEEALELIEKTKVLKDEKKATSNSDDVGKKGGSATEKEKINAKSKKRKRGNTPDLSTLPPEERVRREEQRRMQQEAAARRLSQGDKGSVNKFKHALNSERRRANRRKPKWLRPSERHQDPNEHDISGYHMRRIES